MFFFVQKLLYLSYELVFFCTYMLVQVLEQLIYADLPHHRTGFIRQFLNQAPPGLFLLIKEIIFQTNSFSFERLITEPRMIGFFSLADNRNERIVISLFGITVNGRGDKLVTMKKKVQNAMRGDSAEDYKSVLYDSKLIRKITPQFNNSESIILEERPLKRSGSDLVVGTLKVKQKSEDILEVIKFAPANQHEGCVLRDIQTNYDVG